MSLIMKRAWRMFKKQEVRTDLMFSECLKESWVIAKNLAIANESLPSFDELYNKYKGQVMAQLRQSIKDEMVCEDICIEVFLKVNEFLQDFDSSKANFSTWIHKITYNKIVDYCRGEGKKAQQRVSTSDLVNSEGQEAFTFIGHLDTSADIEHRELQSKITKAMSKLKPQYKRIAELFYIEQLKYEEIAKELDIPMNRVKVTLLRAKVMLQNYLQAEYQMLYR